jgi:hypothetical protein
MGIYEVEKLKKTCSFSYYYSGYNRDVRTGCFEELSHMKSWWTFNGLAIFALVGGPLAVGFLGNHLFHTFKIESVLGLSTITMMWAPILCFATIPVAGVWAVVATIGGAVVESKKDKSTKE